MTLAAAGRFSVRKDGARFSVVSKRSGKLATFDSALEAEIDMRLRFKEQMAVEMGDYGCQGRGGN